MKKCEICGMLRKTTIECPICKRTICLNDFWVQMGICADCVTAEYNQYYGDTIKKYEMDGVSLGG